MITLPEHVLASDAELEGHEGHDWDGKDATTGHANKQTTMDWAEHQRIVCAARGLLQGEPPGNADVRKIFNALRSAYVDADSRTVLRVSKGIHQPKVDPHLQLRTVTSYGADKSFHKFHLNVSAVELPPTKGLEEGRFQWKPVQFSFRHTNGKTYDWPALADVKLKDGMKRRNSMSAADLQAHIDAQIKLQKEEEAAKAVDAFDKALAAFLDAHGGPKRNINHNNPAKQGTFPSDKFRKGNVNASVVGGTLRGITNVYYDKAGGRIVIGQAPRG